MPSFGGEDPPTFGSDEPTPNGVPNGVLNGVLNGVPNGHFNGVLNGTEHRVPSSSVRDPDELSFATSADKVREATEQIAEFLIAFPPEEQRDILRPFLRDDELGRVEDALAEPHIDEARLFVSNYLACYSQHERQRILENWDTGQDAASTTASVTESVTPPSCTTPMGSTTPTAVTPREFLSARRSLNEMYHADMPDHQVPALQGPLGEG